VVDLTGQSLVRFARGEPRAMVIGNCWAAGRASYVGRSQVGEEEGVKGSCEEKTNNKEADDDEDSSLPNKKAIEVQ
jgi:hypothetical protein